MILLDFKVSNVFPRYSQGWRGFWFYGVMVAQEILVLLEIVRFSLELHKAFFLLLDFFYFCTTACESSCALFGINTFSVFSFTYFSQLLVISR